MSRLKDKYQKEVLPTLKKELSLGHDLAVPRLLKIVINVGVGDAKDNPGVLEKLSENLAALAGQKPLISCARKSIAGFKLVKGQPIGLVATLRGVRMYEFLDKLISVVLPKVRDFRGIPDTSFDSRGNFTLGLKEQVIFPEVSFEEISAGKTRGLEISIVTTAANKQQGKRLLELLGMPFKKGVS